MKCLTGSKAFKAFVCQRCNFSKNGVVLNNAQDRAKDLFSKVLRPFNNGNLAIAEKV